MGRRGLLWTAALVAGATAIVAPVALAKPGDLYIAGNEGAGQADIVRMNARTGAVHDVATLPGSGEGDNAAFGKNGRLYVSDETNERVYQVDVATGEVVSIADAGFDTPWALDVAPNGLVLIGDYAAEALFTLNPPSPAVADLASGGALTTLNAVAAAPGGLIYVALGPATGKTAHLLTVDPRNGEQHTVAALPGDGLDDYPQGITVGSDGTVYVARETSIDRFRPGTPEVKALPKSNSFANLFDLELGFDGKLYVVDDTAQVVFRVDRHSGKVGTVGFTGQSSPIGIAVQPPRCAGRTATIVGTQKADRIKGSPGRDVIHGLGGADRIRGLGDDDRICGGRGRDRLFGGVGLDILNGGPGRDRARE